jgi:uncharacterized protein (TIGR02453 family)
MAIHINFSGFSQETVKFFLALKQNNTKEWFSQHKQTFDEEVMEPAKAFVGAMGERLQELAPNIIAVPQVNRSIFRIYRDTRFSPDKTPYKTHLGIFFWEGSRLKMECPGFYFHLEPPSLMLGGGIYMFPKTILEHYRHTVVHPEYGAELMDIMQKIEKRDGYNLGGKHYKRIPVGFDPSHPNADLLLYNGLHVGIEESIPVQFFNHRLLDYCMEKFSPLVELHRWLVALNNLFFSK